jgi:hypothetical protein
VPLLRGALVRLRLNPALRDALPGPAGESAGGGARGCGKFGP